MTPTPSNHSHHQQHGHKDGKKRIYLAATFFLAVLAVVGAQYVALSRADILSRHHPAAPAAAPYFAGVISKEHFIANSVAASSSSAAAVLSDSQKSDVKEKKIPDEIEKEDDEPVGLDYNGTPLHVVFSTSCSEQMHWESYVFFYHALKVRQPGTVTRIASGCNDKEAAFATEFHDKSIRTMSHRFHLHLTPDFSKQRLHDVNKGGYKYMNKPFGLRSWLENVLHMKQNSTKTTTNTVEDGVVILMDPDMVLLRPLVHDFSNQKDVIWVEDSPATTMVKHGYPMAQQDGYLGNQWMYINGTFVTGDPTIRKPKDKFGPLHWNTGPPYLATVKDMYDISLLWTEYAPRVDHINPGLFAEMQGFIWATYKLNLPHTLIKSIVVSTTKAHNREGWPYVDNLPDSDVCAPSSQRTTKLPIFGLHYCKRYALGPDFFFSKYRLKKNFLSCEKNLLMPPPMDIHTKYDYFIGPPPADGKPPRSPPEKKTFDQKQAKREAFMLCGMIDAVNEAATVKGKRQISRRLTPSRMIPPSTRRRAMAVSLQRCSAGSKNIGHTQIILLFHLELGPETECADFLPTVVWQTRAVAKLTSSSFLAALCHTRRQEKSALSHLGYLV